MKLKPYKFLGVSIIIILLLAVALLIARVNVLLIIPILAGLISAAYQYAVHLKRRGKIDAVKEMRDLYLEHRWNESGKSEP